MSQGWYLHLSNIKARYLFYLDTIKAIRPTGVSAYQNRGPLRHHEEPRRAGAWSQRRTRNCRQAARAHQGAIPHPILR